LQFQEIYFKNSAYFTALQLNYFNLPHPLRFQTFSLFKMRTNENTLRMDGHKNIHTAH